MHFRLREWRQAPVPGEGLALAFGFVFALKPVVGLGLPHLSTLVFDLLVVGLAFGALLALPGAKARGASLGEAWPPGAPPLLLLVGWMAASLAWTRAASPLAGLLNWGELALGLLVVWLLIRIGDVGRVAQRMLHGMVAGALAFCLAVLAVWPTDADGRLGDPAWLHPNLIGDRAALLALCALYLMLSRRERPAARLGWGLAALVLAGVLLLSLSKAALIGFAVAAGWMVTRARLPVGLKLALAGGGLAGLGLASPMLIGYLDRYLNQAGAWQAAETLTGRTDLWGPTLAMVAAHPLIGHGYSAFQDVGPDVLGLAVQHPHNEWLHLAFSFGAVGVGLGLWVVVAFAARARAAMTMPSTAPQAVLAEVILVYELLRGLVEASPNALNFPPALMLLMLAWLAARRRRTAIAGRTLRRTLAA